MKPYAPSRHPLSLLAPACQKPRRGRLRPATFSSRELLFERLRSEATSVLGIYANLMTRGNAVEIIRVAREAGWRVVVGGPEPGAYALEDLQSGADFVVFGEGESTMEELPTALCAEKTKTNMMPAGRARLRELRTSMRRALSIRIRQGHRFPIWMLNPGGTPCNRCEALCRSLAQPPRQGFSEFHHRAQLSL